MELNKEFESIRSVYDKDFSAHFLDKPIYLDDEEKCFCVTSKKLFICDPYEKKPSKQINHTICFSKIPDMNVFLSLCLFLLDDDNKPDTRSTGEWGWQMVLLDKGDRYEIDYYDGFITGDARGGNDFQCLTSDWQW